MLLKVQRDNIFKHLDIVEKGLPVKTTMPVINNIFVEINGSDISFITTNLEISIKSTMNLDEQLISENDNSKKDEKVLLPVKFIDIIRHLPSGKEIFIKIEKENKKIEIKCDNSIFNLKGINADDYPLLIDKNPEKKPLFFKEKELKKIIRETVFATSNDESRPAFTGVLFLIDNGKLHLIASDTYRMVVEEKDNDLWEYEINKFLVPARSLKELMKLLKDDEGEVLVFPVDNKLAFSFGNVYFETRLLEDNFPDFRRVLPSQVVTRVLINKNKMDEIIGRAALISDNNNNAVHVELEEEKIKMRASSEVGDMVDEIPIISREGEDITILLNIKYLSDVFKVLDSENIDIQFSGKEAPCVIRPEGENNYIYLVLPIKVDQPF